MSEGEEGVCTFVSGVCLEHVCVRALLMVDGGTWVYEVGVHGYDACVSLSASPGCCRGCGRG